MNMVLAHLVKNWQRLSLEQFGVPNRLSYIMATPRFRSSSHVVFMILVDEQRDPVLAVKVPRIPGDNDSLYREAANLRLVQSARPGGFDTIPRLIGCESYLGNRFLIETAMVGGPFHSRGNSRNMDSHIEMLTTWLIELHTATKEISGSAEGWYERLVESPLQQFIKSMPPSKEEGGLVAQTLGVADLLRDQEMPLVFEQRDLSLPNILVSQDGGVGVLDWELAEPRGLPAVDLFFFLTLVAFARRRARSQAEYLAAFREAFFGPSAWARPHVVRYARSLQLPLDLCTPLFVLCWSRYVVDLVVRLHGFDSPGRLVGEETTGWLRSNRFYALWCHSIKHLNELRWAGDEFQAAEKSDASYR